jgi:hypothetical protein
MHQFYWRCKAAKANRFCGKWQVCYQLCRAIECLTARKIDLDRACARRTRPLGHVNMPCLVIIESVFATVRHRTVRTKGALSHKTAKLMVFTLIQAASKSWRRLNGRNQLPKAIEGIKFTNGVEVTDAAETSAA